MSERHKYRENLISLLSKWIAEIDKIEAKIRKTGADPKADCAEAIKALRLQRKGKC
jgi:hypothetical protein